MPSSYLSDKEIKIIENKLMDIFTEDTHKKMSLNVQALKNEIDYILNKVTLKQNKSLYRASKEKKMLMAESYLIIFKVRKFLLDESINYRYYYSYKDDLGQIQGGVVSFDENNILNFMSLLSGKIKVANKILKQQERDLTYQSMLDQHIQLIMSGIRPATDHPTFKIVHSDIFEKYSGINAGLHKKGQPTVRQVFTIGHIFEAMDIAFSESMEKFEQHLINTISPNNIQDLVFGKYLNYDTIPGTKGGDNPYTLTEVKSNAADIMDYYTLIKNLKEIKELLTVQSKPEMKKQIMDLYVHKGHYATEEMWNKVNNNIDKAINKIIKQNLTTTK